MCPTLCDPMDYTVPGILQAKILEWVAFAFFKGSPQPRSPSCRQILFQLSHKGSPRTLVCMLSHSVVSDSCDPWTVRRLCPWNSPGNNTGVGCHFLLQGIFLTQGLNWGLLHCRKMFYQLSYQGISETQ